MSDNTKQAVHAREFVKECPGQEYEKGKPQRFWIPLLRSMFGVEAPESIIEFEIR